MLASRKPDRPLLALAGARSGSARRKSSGLTMTDAFSRRRADEREDLLDRRVADGQASVRDGACGS
jgi:hypothetical protein